MKKIKFIIKLIVFVCIFLCLFICLSYIVRPESEMKTRFTGFYNETDDTIDVVVIGSSQIAPLIAAPYIWNEYNLTVYPLSTNAQPVAGIKYIVDEACKTQPDSLYVIDVSMFMVGTETLLTEPRIRNIVDNMKYSINRLKAINELVKIPSERVDYYFDISKYHSVIMSEDGLDLGDIKYFDFSYASKYKGYLFVDAVAEFEPIDISSVTDSKAIPADAEQELITLIKSCKDKDLEVIFIISPYVASTDKKMYHNYLESFIEDKGYDFIDFNDLCEDIGINFSRDLYNTNHLNLSGGMKFSNYFGKYLVDNYEFTDKTLDERYIAWELSYEAWNTQAIITQENIEKNILKIRDK